MHGGLVMGKHAGRVKLQDFGFPVLTDIVVKRGNIRSETPLLGTALQWSYYFSDTTVDRWYEGIEPLIKFSVCLNDQPRVDVCVRPLQERRGKFHWEGDWGYDCGPTAFVQSLAIHFLSQVNRHWQSLWIPSPDRRFIRDIRLDGLLGELEGRIAVYQRVDDNRRWPSPNHSIEVMKFAREHYHHEIDEELYKPAFRLPTSKSAYCTDKSCGVYLVQCGPFLKIGHTRSGLGKRISSMSTGNPVPIVPVAVVEAADAALESELHERFIAHHVRGEWFHDVSPIRDWFEANGKMWNDHEGV